MRIFIIFCPLSRHTYYIWIDNFLLRKILPFLYSAGKTGILWFNFQVYKPQTARCESAPVLEKCEKLEAVKKRKGKTNPGDCSNALSQVASAPCSRLASLRAARLSRTFRKTAIWAPFCLLLSSAPVHNPSLLRKNPIRQPVEKQCILSRRRNLIEHMLALISLPLNIMPLL